jgi:predicted nucleotidyltransferase
MKTLEEIKTQLQMLKPILREQFGVVTIGVFGSFSRREQTGKSDLDVFLCFLFFESFG